MSFDLPDDGLAQKIQSAIDGKTKPPGSLGRIEALAAQIAHLQGSERPDLTGCSLTIFAADHGIAADGVSAYPQIVTRQMVLNFLSGGAAATVFAATLGAQVQVVDAGIAGEPLDAPGLMQHRIAAGTASFLRGPAMSAEERDRALSTGRDLGAGGPETAAAFGEMGIGNTSAATLLSAKLTGRDPDALVGRGTGIDDAGLARKRALLAQAAGRTPRTLDAPDALAEYGGFEIVMMAGAMLGAANAGRVVLVDGFIATAAALAALALDPGIRPALVFAHVSAEPGHKAVLDHLGAVPLLDLELRLGEGTGALLAWPLVQAAVAMLRDMASFESAHVSGRE